MATEIESLSNVQKINWINEAYFYKLNWTNTKIKIMIIKNWFLKKKVFASLYGEAIMHEEEFHQIVSA